MTWQFWKKRKKRTNAGVIEPIAKGQSEGGGRKPMAFFPVVPNNPAAPYQEYEVLPASTPNPSPMIHQITAPIIWRDSPIGSRFGPGRCNLACTEVHAWAEKVSPTHLAFQRPCVLEDLGAAEWRARQKR